MFGRKKNVIATYSRNRPVQSTRNNHFLTPDTPEDWLASSSKEKRPKQDTNKKGKSAFGVNAIIVAWQRNDGQGCQPPMSSNIENMIGSQEDDR